MTDPPPPQRASGRGDFPAGFRAWLRAASVEGPVRRSVLRRIGAAISVWYVRLSLLPGALVVSPLSVVAALAVANGFRSGARMEPRGTVGEFVGMTIISAVQVAALLAYARWAPVGVGPRERTIARGAAAASGVAQGVFLVANAVVLWCA